MASCLTRPRIPPPLDGWGTLRTGHIGPGAELGLQPVGSPRFQRKQAGNDPEIRFQKGH